MRVSTIPLPLAVAGLLLGFSWGCNRTESPSPTPDTASAPTAPAPSPTTTPTTGDYPEVGPKPASWVDSRVAEARNRLQASEPGRLIWQAIEAHGGLSTWVSQGTVEFEFDYRPLGNPEGRRHSFQRIDLWRAHGRHEELGEGADAEFGFDGEHAWIAPAPESFPSTARFWTTTPYYFLGMPFVLGDPGAKFERLPDAELDGTPHRLVKVTYDEGTGDSSDDYYVVYLHAEQGTLTALRYIVAYPGFFEEGDHSPEKMMVYSEVDEVEGLRIAHRLDTYSWDVDAGVRGEKVTEVTASRVAFGRTYPDDLFAPIEGAHIEPPLPAR
ncbi:MAG: hypothetical protein K8J08_07185 [Thermoanaerobaculia bacterium]|nr:hypothetical protein [Thermoanaerobaculia bacterium]